ncbi:aspartate--tRNA(Asn) ligase [Candidatus Pacearchaeota archaeon]|nr:aspartate--tRNA(Asn) ligase [Candidatus Pacearchaeota archaeon]
MTKLSRESVIAVHGKVKESKQAPGGKEIIPDRISILSKAEHPLPIDVSDFSKTELPKRLDWRFLDTRRKKILSIFKVRSEIYKSVVNFFDSKGFMNINTPKLTTIGLESGADVFKVDYFGKPVSLAQSPQFYKQMFVVGGFEKVYEIGAVYRAEKSHTIRHLTEFTGVDFEMGFIKDFNDIMDVIEEMMKKIIQDISHECKKELDMLGVKLKIPSKIPRITMREAKNLLKEKGKNLDEDDDLDSESEKLLGDIIQKKYGEDFVFVTLYPWSKRPFYHMKPDNDKDVTLSFDLLYNGVEIATGAQREHRLEILEQQAKEKGLKVDPTYANIFKFGVPPHGGVGFGLDRITQRMLNLDNIREAILLPRDPERVTP